MQVRLGKSAMCALALLALAACGSDNPQLLNITSTTEGPDEFAIVPNRPLEAPEDFNALPPPTPGRGNRTDANPNADAIVALGGRPEALQSVPTRDAGIVTAATRYGVSPDIRQTLAAEDLDFRRRKDGRLLERLFNVNVYFRAYDPMSLDQYAELERFRRLGVRTPAAPPKPQ
ncbi:DUF3035 domain-containing protein [Psychromarinibacter sp. C21-152]|uniref:DUF3035 domain-containing protein n=1 Tax=Psychromarinibacter sediminicola TaxID=3033385 RepID=A0AAE3NTP1_9RHOB|nr:DUF3035 domain-containing protein [Psychromarinibacter sediminicola]MDF0601816.1 DUF3035 domain-containing protein [Psychromarinibacter sediminicola]